MEKINILESYRQMGWQLVPIPKGKKTPAIEDWKTPRTYLPDEFENIGVLLGEPSSDLVDIDIDDLKILPYAKYFLPATATFGRESKPKSHFLYYSKNSRYKKFTLDKKVLLEIRTNNHQTVIPPSIHPSGEQIKWCNDYNDIISIDSDDLYKVCSLLCAASFLSDYWQEGARQDLAMYVAGIFLKELQFTEDVTRHFIYSICDVTGDDQVDLRLRTIETTANKINVDEKIGTWGKLEEIIGEDAVKTLKSWLITKNNKKNRKKDTSFISLVDLLQSDDSLNKRLRYNSFTRKHELDGEPIEDYHANKFRYQIHNQYGVEYSRNVLDEAVAYISEENEYNPLQDYLNGLEWDKADRFTMLYSILGIKSDLDKIYVRKFLLAAVARALEPGIKAENVLVLVGPEGYFKSTFFKKLCPDESWFSDQLQGIERPDDLALLQGKWIIELSEMYAFSKAKTELVRRFLSKQEDEYRPPYARNSKCFKRQCIFAGTANPTDILDDEYGNRRFWVIAIHSRIRTDKLDEIRDQLWAQVVYYYKHGESFLLSLDEEKRRAKRNEDFTAYDELEGLVLEHIHQKKIGFSTVMLVNWLGMAQNQRTYKRLSRILRKHGYRQRIKKGVPGRRWFPERFKLKSRLDKQWNDAIRYDEIDEFVDGDGNSDDNSNNEFEESSEFEEFDDD